MNYLIDNVLVPENGGYRSIALQIADSRIHAIDPVMPLDGSTVIDGCDKLLLPGLVNAHTHSSQIWQRGAIPQLPLELWLADAIDSTPTSLEHFYLGAMSTAVDTILSGGTCVVDHAYILPGQEIETVAALVRGYREVGIRAVIAPLIHDLSLEAGLPSRLSGGQQEASRSAREILEVMEAIIKQYHHPEVGIYIALGPTGFHRCSDRLLEGCIELSDRYNLCRHTHLLETRTQRQLATERYGRSAVEHLQEMGFLGDRTSLAHCVWLGEKDIEILADTRSTVVHNPLSNLRLGSGLAPILQCYRQGVNISFGCDGAASNDAQNMLEVIKLGTILHHMPDVDYQNWLTPHTVIEMAALGGNKGINLNQQVGTLKLGQLADLVLYDLAHPSLIPCYDPIQLLVLGRPTDVVDRVWIEGRLIVEKGQMLTVDVEALNQELRERSQRNPLPRFQTIHRLEPLYRKVMLQDC